MTRKNQRALEITKYYYQVYASLLMTFLQAGIQRPHAVPSMIRSRSKGQHLPALPGISNPELEEREGGSSWHHCEGMGGHEAAKKGRTTKLMIGQREERSRHGSEKSNPLDA